MLSRWDRSPDIIEDQVFYFQAEDGIRDLTVTGVQTCALPISPKADVRHLTCELVAGPVVVRPSPMIAPHRHGRLVRKSLPSSGLMESSGGAGAHPYSDFVRTHVGEPWNGVGSGNGDGANDSGNGNGI